MLVRVQSAAEGMWLAFGLVLVAWGVADYLFPAAVLRAQARVLPLPDRPPDTLVEHKRRIGLVCVLAGLLAIATAIA